MAATSHDRHETAGEECLLAGGLPVPMSDVPFHVVSRVWNGWKYRELPTGRCLFPGMFLIVTSKHQTNELSEQISRA